MPGVDWVLIARTAHECRLTLVIYMGVQTAEQLQNALLEGLPGDTPVAVVENASLPSQRHACTLLAQLSEVFVRENLGSPAVIIVGDVLLGMQNMSVAKAPAAALGG
jgi:uroporphyrin-III C-methyltransferase